MNVHNRIRGVLSVRSEGMDQVYRELHASVADFKDRHQKELKNMQRHIDDMSARMAAFQMNGGGNDNGDMVRAQAAVTKFLRTGDASAMSAMGTPLASMATDSAPDGGFTVPTEIDALIQSQLIALSPMRTACGGGRVVGTSDYHKIISKRGATVGWAGERDPRSETETPQLADIAPPMGELWAYPSITQWALDDSQFDLANFLQEEVVDEFALQEGSAFMLGDGIKKPIGLMSAPASDAEDEVRPFGTFQFVKSGAASGFTSVAPGDALIDLVYAVKTVYRAGTGVGWQMNSKTASAVRKFKDGDGNYLWQQSTSAGQPSTLLGYPVWENEDMPDIAADAFPIAFGNWPRGYLIVDRVGVRVVRDPYTKPGWMRFYISRRVGGAPTDSRAIKFLKIAA